MGEFQLAPDVERIREPFGFLEKTVRDVASRVAGESIGKIQRRSKSVRDSAQKLRTGRKCQPTAAIKLGDLEAENWRTSSDGGSRSKRCPLCV